MRPTKTLIGQEAKKAILQGVNIVYQAAGRTLGPEGKNALLYGRYNNEPRITNDGYTVAGCQDPQNIFVRLAARSFNETCKRTNVKVGDGTTTTVVIGGKLYNDVYALLNEGISDLTQKGKVGVMALKKQILDTAKIVKDKIKEKSVKISSLEDLEKIATVSVEDKSLGKVIAEMSWKTGIDGFIDVVDGFKGTIETEVIEGMRFPAKIPAKAFVNKPERYQMEVIDCPVLITNYAIDNTTWQETGQLFQKLNANTTKIAVIAPSFSENILIHMVNASKQGYYFFPIAAPSLRLEQFQDLSIYFDAKLIDKFQGMKFRNVGPDYLGFVERLIVKDTETKEDAYAVGGRGAQPQYDKLNIQGIDSQIEKPSKIQERIKELKGQLEETRQDQFKLLMQRRIASLASAGGVIRVGDTTAASAHYLKMKIDDAVWASKAALRGGYVKGGGLCLKEIADELPDDNILKAALLQPYNQIQASFENGLEISEDIVDPAEALYYAVEHATQVVAQLSTVEIITAETEEVQWGDSNLAVARAIGDLSLTMKRHLGLMKDNEEEMERDRLYKTMLDQDNMSDLLELNNQLPYA